VLPVQDPLFRTPIRPFEPPTFTCPGKVTAPPPVEPEWPKVKVLVVFAVVVPVPPRTFCTVQESAALAEPV